ncbi:MBL fold metallo-hydrolase [Clostridioides difficile]
MNKLLFLGRGSGYHTKEKNTAAYIKKDNTLLLIDCGETVFKSILEKNLIEGINEINVLITHMHSDHIGSLGGFIGFCYWKYKIITKVYFNEKEKISMFLKLLGLRENESFVVHDAENKRIDSLQLKFSGFITKHVKAIKTYSYKLEFDNENVHTLLRVLSEIIPKKYRNQVYCIHIDGENFVEEVEKQGFNVVEVI